MNHAPPKKRPWFQLHLSTCVVLMFVAGVLIAANLIEYTPGYSVDMDSDDVLDYDKYFGWPSSALREYIHIGIANPPSTVDNAFDPVVWRREWIGVGIAINVSVAFAILYAIALACEWFIRRRERKRAATEAAP